MDLEMGILVKLGSNVIVLNQIVALDVSSQLPYLVQFEPPEPES
jgi:hypothetical protein